MSVLTPAPIATSISFDDQQITKQLSPLMKKTEKTGRITNPAEEAAFWHNLLVASFNGTTEAQFTIFGRRESEGDAPIALDLGNYKSQRA
jgi:hypothetical protein